MRGRPPKPTRIKVLTGNPGKRPLNPHEPRPEAVVPDCPAALGPVAKQEWERLAGELAKLRILTALDRSALAACCNAYGLWIEAVEAIGKYGSMVKSPSGYPIQSPYVAIANRQAELMLRVEAAYQRQRKSKRPSLMCLKRRTPTMLKTFVNRCLSLDEQPTALR
jgi:P27 family predicted phage terminase small subunit